MADIQIGAKREEQLLVTGEQATDFLGHEGARVLSTPHMIAYMEMTARNLVKQFLDSAHDTVGTVVNIRHVDAAVIGSVVTFEAEVLSVIERRVNLRISAHENGQPIGEGTHERAVINVERFAAKLAEKKR